jgi:hypothetical protein
MMKKMNIMMVLFVTLVLALPLGYSKIVFRFSRYLIYFQKIKPFRVVMP